MEREEKEEEKKKRGEKRRSQKKLKEFFLFFKLFYVSSIFLNFFCFIIFQAGINILKNQTLTHVAPIWKQCQRWPSQNWSGGLKSQQKVNIEGLERVDFFRGPKSQHMNTWGAKIVIKPIIYAF